MSLDLDHLRTWIGRTDEASDIVTAQLVKGLRATLFLDIGKPQPGDIAPFTAHWCLAQPVAPADQLGEDGHPARGGFLPPVPLPRRMWAGGQLEFLDTLRVGDAVTRASKILDVTLKTGSTGALCFVSVEHLITTPRGLAIRERQDIVYRDALLQRLTEADIAFAEVNEMADLSTHPHLRRITVVTPNGDVSYPAPAAIFVDAPRDYGAVPAIGEVQK